MARRGAADDKVKKEDEVVRFWLAEIAASRRRERDYRKDGKRIREIYDGSKRDETPFNICYSNTETIAPALYSRTPRPVVQRRYKDNDQIGLAAAKAAQRMLEFQLDTNLEGYETFHETMKGVTLDGLLPGRGVASLKYDADITGDVKQSELVCTELQSWDRVYFGYAKKWSKVPWVAYELYIDKPEATTLFGATLAGEIEYSAGADTDEDGKPGDDRNTGERKTALIYQIWDKDSRTVKYVSPHYTDGMLKEQEDPYKLTGFFNCPKPLQFLDKTDELVPTALYTLYENQASELNQLTVRISRIVNAIKARGLYAGEVSDDIQNIMDADDNKMVPVETAIGAAGEKALSNAIWFWPVDVLIKVLSELYAAREACKQVIYEIMGIGDILRGASKASETLGAQQIKSQWGTMRLKPKQGEVERYARDMLRMMVEMAAAKFSQDTWAKMTGLPYLTDTQIQQAQQMQQALQQQMQQAQMMAQQQAMAAAQAPQQINPAAPQAPQAPQPQSAQIMLQQAQQQLQQVQQTLQETPKWVDILKTLNDDLQRAYKIDVETNSTIEPEAAEDQKNIADLLTAMSQFLNGVGPLVAQGVMPFQVAQSMLLAITRRFRFGDEIEDQIKSMQAPQQPNQDKQAAQDAQNQVTQIEQQAQAQKAKSDGDVQALTLKLQQAQGQVLAIQKEKDLDIRELKVKAQEHLLAVEKQAAVESLANKTSTENTKLDSRKQVTALEAKQAKTEQVVSKTVDSKMGESVKALGGMIEQLVNTITQQSQNTQELIAAVKAPRKKTAIRGKDGRISQTVEEVLQ